MPSSEVTVVQKPYQEKASEESKKRGRPRLELNAENVEKLAAIACTNQEIADVLDVSKDTIERNYAAALKSGRGNMSCSLKRKQFELAMTGNVTMLTLLGKNYCGQTDKVEQKITVEDQTAIPDSVVDKAIAESLKLDLENLGELAA